MKNLLLNIGWLVALLISSIEAKPKIDLVQTINDINGSENPGHLGDSLSMLLERNVYRLKTHCDSIPQNSKSVLRSLSKGYGLLIEQYQKRRSNLIANGGNPTSVDSLDYSIQIVKSYRYSVDKILLE
jgi:hypothetical protein